MLEIVGKLVKSFDEKKVRYCHWKSNIHLQAAVDGETDLDILVDRHDASKVSSIFANLDIKRVTSLPYQQYPSISDYIGFDSLTGEFIHIHLHYQLLLGSSGIKECHFPIEDYFLDNIIKRDGIFVPTYEIEMIFFLIRMSFKRTNYYLLKRYIRNKIKAKKEDEFVVEFNYLISKINVEKYNEVISLLPIKDKLKQVLNTIGDSKNLPTKLQTIKIVSYFNEFKRLNSLEIISLRLYKSLYSIQANLFNINKKELATGGVTIGIVGIDGTGKTTLTNSLQDKLSWKLRVSHQYFGSSRYKSLHLWIIALPFLILEKLFSSFKILKYFRALALTLMEWGFFKQRERAYFTAFKSKSKGSISLCERYPLEKHSDWPHIILDLKGEETNSKIISYKNKLEELYKLRFSKPDILIVLTVDSDDAFARKPDHSKDMIFQKNIRMNQFIDENKNVKNVFIVDSSIGKEAVLKRSLNIIWENL